MRSHTQSKFSVHGSSLNRIAYYLGAVSLLLLALHPFTETYVANKRIMGAAFVLTIVVLLLCLLTQRTVRNRWLPFLIAFILLLIHGLFVPHL